MIISDYYQSLPTKEQKRDFRNKVCERLGITYPAFYHKIRRRFWRKAEETIIESIIEEFNNAGED